MAPRTDRRGVRGHQSFFGLVQESLLEYAEKSFSLDKRDSKGVSAREYLEQVQRSLGRQLPELQMPEFPDVAHHIWDTFLSLHAGRSYGMSGPNPLSWGDIKAWCDLTGVHLEPWEADMLKALDMVWVRAMNESGDG